MQSVSNLDEISVIKRCQQFDRRAQKAVYDRYAPVMLGICRRYIRDWMEAENAMSEGFYKAFTRMRQYRFEGSFEGWLKRIMVNECLMLLRKRNDFNVSLETSNVVISGDMNADQAVEVNSILEFLDRLPTGYRTIFNMYAIEGYQHKEIAEQLGISINTSKSQLIKARKRLQALLEDEQSQTG